MTGVYPLRTVVVALGLLTGCAHQDPFPDGQHVDNGPRSTTPPIQLTFSAGDDRSPAWTADGAAFAYALDREDGVAGDRCLGRIPAAGGTRDLTKCLVAADSDTVRSLGPVMPGPGGRVAWIDARSLVGRLVPDRESIRVGGLAPYDSGVAVRTFPYRAPSGLLHATATSLTWLSPTQLVYIGNDRLLVGPCSGCKPDTLLVAREAMRLDLSTTPATLQPIANTSEVTSLASPDGETLYLTRAGDSRVFSRVGGDAETVVYDFLGSIVRGVTVRGNVLLAVVGGKVNYAVDPVIGARQIDSGGVLVRLDLATGAATEIPMGELLVSHPSIAPDGRSALVEAVDPLSASRLADLWLVPLP